MKTPFILLFFIVSLTCYGQKTFTLADHPVTKLEGKQIKTDMLLDPIYLCLFDSFLFIQNYQTKFHFDMLNLKNGKNEGNFCREGRGPGEVIFPKTIQILREQNKILIYDINLKKVNYYKLDAVLENNPDNYIHFFQIDSAYAKRVFLLKNGNFLCPLVGDKLGHKFCRLNQKHEFVNYATLYPDVGKEYPKIVSSNLFSAWADINNNRNKVILAYDHWDMIDIITDIETLHEINIRGTKYKIPDFDARNLALTYNNILAYASPCAGVESFFVLFSGEKVYDEKKRTKTLRNYKTALQFDYEGNLLNVYHLDPGVRIITVDWDKKIIYGINKELEPTLYEYRF